ncbi:MAG: NERD domain-containing protein [Planctomycetota bacterium]
MALMIPDRISTNSPGERDLFLRLKNSSDTENWFVLHSLDIAEHSRQVGGEIDMIVVIPGMGVLCLEVKACQSLRIEQGAWYYGRNPKPDFRGPFKQASSAMHSLRGNFFSRGPLAKTVFVSGVVFTHVTFDLASPEWHTWQFIDSRKYQASPIAELLRSMLANARQHLSSTPSCRWFNPESPEPTPGQCKDIANILRPNFEVFESPKSRSRRTQTEIKKFTQEQFVALDAMKGNDRVLYKGPAGTGKTVLAIEAVRRACLNQKRALFLCYNRLLSKKLAEEVGELEPKVHCSTLHSLLLKIAGKSTHNPEPEFWRSELPSLALESLIQDSSSQQYDYLVVDEVQDLCHAPYLDVLDCLLSGGLRQGSFAVFGDFEKQAIYSQGDRAPEEVFGDFTEEVPSYSLRTNCRNRPRLAGLAHLLGQLKPNYTRILREDDGVDCFPTYYRDSDDQVKKLIDALESAYRDGFRGQSIVVLSPSANDKCCASKIQDQSWAQRLKPIEASDPGYIRFGTVHSFKGLEAEFVILTDIESILGDMAQQLFYTGVTRALERLVILAKEKSKADVVRVLTST